MTDVYPIIKDHRKDDFSMQIHVTPLEYILFQTLHLKFLRLPPSVFNHLNEYDTKIVPIYEEVETFKTHWPNIKINFESIYLSLKLPKCDIEFEIALHKGLTKYGIPWRSEETEQRFKQKGIL